MDKHNYDKCKYDQVFCQNVGVAGAEVFAL